MEKPDGMSEERWEERNEAGKEYRAKILRDRHFFGKKVVLEEIEDELGKRGWRFARAFVEGQKAKSLCDNPYKDTPMFLENAGLSHYFKEVYKNARKNKK